MVGSKINSNESSSSESIPDSLPLVKNEQEKAIEDKLRESIVKSMSEQSDKLDDLAKQLITLQLAIPGLYAVAFKIVHGAKQAEQAAQTGNYVLIFITFLIFAIALGLTLFSLFPRQYNVEMKANILSEVRKLPLGSYRINEFYYYSAKHKRCFIAIATALTFIGICFSVITTIII